MKLYNWRSREIVQATEEQERYFNNLALRSLPDCCSCGHGRFEHYDGWDFCTWTLDDQCACGRYTPKES